MITSQDGDEYARYKMIVPIIRTRHLITYITNINDVAKTIKTNVLYIVKFLGRELNTIVKYESKMKEMRINGIRTKKEIIEGLR